MNRISTVCPILQQTVVISAIDLRTLSKLKFRRGSSVTLVLKGGENREFLTPQVILAKNNCGKKELSSITRVADPWLRRAG